MNRLALIILLCIMPLSLMLAEEEGILIQGGGLKGSEYRELSEGERASYSMGIVEGILLAPWFAGEQIPKIDFLHQCIVGMTNKQLSAIFDKYLNEHPEKWHKYMSFSVLGAMIETCKL